VLRVLTAGGFSAVPAWGSADHADRFRGTTNRNEAIAGARRLLIVALRFWGVKLRISVLSVRHVTQVLDEPRLQFFARDDGVYQAMVE
jgi:hypothetical protein